MFIVSNNIMLEQSTMQPRCQSNIPYRKVRELGSGSFGTIFLVEHMHEKSFWVSKEIPIEKLEVRITRKRQ
jgi:serine/threonine protein kinase